MPINQIMPLDQARQAVEDLKFGTSDTKMRDLAFQVTGKEIKLRVGDEFLPLTPVAERNLKFYTGIDGVALAEYGGDAELVGRMIRHSLGKRDGDLNLRVTRQANRVFEFLAADWPWISPPEVFAATVDVIGASRIHGLAGLVDWKGKMRMKFVTQMIKEPPKKKGDISHAGLWVSSNGNVEVGSYVHRQVCSNGAMADWEVTKAEGSRDSYVTNMRQNLARAMNDAENRLNEFISLDEHHETDVMGFFGALQRAGHLSERQLSDAVSTAASLVAQPTRYDVVNLITSLAHTVAANADPEKWEWSGGKAQKHYAAHQCGTCHTPLKK